MFIRSMMSSGVCMITALFFFLLIRMAQGVIMWSPVFSLWDLLCVCWGVVTFVSLVDLCLRIFLFRYKVHTVIYASMRDYFWNQVGSRWHTLAFMWQLRMFDLSERYPVYVLLRGVLVYTGFRAIFLILESFGMYL